MPDLDRVLNPEKRFLEYQDYLIDLIASSYHKGSKDLIAHRIKEAFYFFDTLPPVAFKTLKDIGYNPKTHKELFDYYVLNKDYHLASTKVRKSFAKDTDSYLREMLQTNKRFYNQNKNVILGLHFESFSKGIKEIIIDSDIDKKIRDAFVEIQQDYLDTCRSIGLTPLVDEKKIQSFLEFEERREKLIKQNIINGTLFGQKILLRLESFKDLSLISKLNMATGIMYLDDKENATTSRYKVSEDTNVTVVSLPVLKLMLTKALDLITLHELVHVVEMDLSTKSILADDTYHYFNEFRTQDKARCLFEKLRKDNIHIFDQDDNNDTIYKNNYDYFIPYIRSLLDDYQYLFDYCGLANRMAPIYKAFKRENFIALCNYLTMLYETTVSSDIPLTEENLNIDLYYEQLDKTKTYAKRKKIYNKTNL